jgi:trehalose synthase
LAARAGVIEARSMSLGYGPIIPRPTEESLAYAPAALKRELRTLAHRIRDRRILFLTRAGSGDRASQDASGCVRVMRHLGVDVHWFFVRSADDHDALGRVEDRSEWMTASFRVACRLPGTWDVAVVLGPELAGVAAVGGERARAWVIGCQQPEVDLDAEWLASCLPAVSCVVVDHPQRAVSATTRVIRGAIDPVAPANLEMDPRDARRRCRELDIDPGRRLLCQITGYGSWEPLQGVLDAYWKIKDAMPAIQLALACPLPPTTDDQRTLWRRLQAHASEDPDIHLLSTGRPERVNAVRSCADVVISGVALPAHGPEAAEAKFKRKPVIACRGGSADHVIEHGVAGYLTDSIDDTVRRALELLNNPMHARRLGRAGYTHVRKSLLLPTRTRNWLRLLNDLVAEDASARRPARALLDDAASVSHRDT